MRRERIQQIVDEFPEDVDLDELMEKLYLLHKIEVGEREIAAGKGIPHEDVKKRLEQWLR